VQTYRKSEVGKAANARNGEARLALAKLVQYLGGSLGQNTKNGGLATATKKIEQDASGNCRKSEYLTLLNTFGILQRVIGKTLANTINGKLLTQSPNIIDEKELYGCRR